MRKLLPAHRYEVHLPIVVRAPGQTLVTGVTNFMSTRDVSFRLEKPHAIARGAAVTLYVSLPPEFTASNRVLIRARGHVLNVRRGSRSRTGGSAFIAAMDSYAFVPKEEWALNARII